MNNARRKMPARCIAKIQFSFSEDELQQIVDRAIVRCKNCKHRIVNKHYGEKGYLDIKAECELDTGDPFALGRNAEDDEWFCADAEAKESILQEQE